MLRKLFFINVFFAVACTDSKQPEPDFNVPGKIIDTCIREGVADDAVADTVLRYRATKDSIFFSQDVIANCCGSSSNLRLAAVGDTIKVIDVSKSKENVQCDCICYFRVQMNFEAKFYETTDKVILWWRSNRILNQ